VQQLENARQCIDEVLTAYQELINLLLQQREALVEQDKGRIQYLNQCLQDQLTITAQCQQKYQDMYIRGAWAAQSDSQLWWTLRRNGQRVQFEGQLNQEIIADLLAYTDYSLRLLLPEHYQAEGYNAQGRRGLAGSQQAVPRQVDKAA